MNHGCSKLLQKTPVTRIESESDFVDLGLHLADGSTTKLFGQLLRSKPTFPGQISTLTFGHKQSPAFATRDYQASV
jgi:hypothetical protein